MATSNIRQFQRDDTAANWTSANPVLAAGEIGWASDIKNWKIGDGTTAWNSLPWMDWFRIDLATDFTTTSTTASDVTGLGFAPLANTKYEFEVMLLLRSAAGTTGPQPGLTWPTGLTDGVVRLFASTAVNAEIFRHGNSSAAVLVPNTGYGSTTTSYLGGGSGILIAGASPSGNLQVQLASEVSASTVTAKAGSYLRYKVLR